MKSFMSLSLFVLGLISVLLGLAIIIRDRLVSRVAVMKMTAPEKKNFLDAITGFINALANFAEKLFGQFASKEKLPVFLIIIGLVICGFGWWLNE
jgi:hypothetical protein